GPDVDLGDRLVTPAFVNAHTHLALSFLRGVPAGVRNNLVEDLYFHFESKLTPEDVRAFSRMGAYESLPSGVGFVWDHYYGGQAVAEALLDTGLAGVSAPTLQDLAGPGKDQSEAALEATLNIAHEARYRGAGVLAALGPHATDTVSPGLFRRIGELAAHEGLPVHLHLAQSYQELLRLEQREGRSPLGVLSREGVLARAPHVVLAHALYTAESELRTLDRERHTLVFCPSSLLQFAFPPALPLWSRLGCRWVVATDCASSNDSMNLQKELRWAAGAASAQITGSFAYSRFLERGRVQDAEETWQRRREDNEHFAPHVDSARLLARVWHEPGAMHPALKVGAIEAGALANLAVWDFDHPAFWPGDDPLRALAFGDTTQALFALYVAGKAIGTPGDFVHSIVTTSAYREARREAQARLSQLLG
ncbi:MAG TPA: amidohydrolase family protein, partial [Polyangiaceae bacterium]|nr:amidohydrolase family protein [Polyangiaceae bacterium]